MSGAVASRCRISTCGDAVSRSGLRSRVSGATSRRRSPSRQTSPGKAGGDYWNTNYPQPTYVSSRRYALHVETTAYSAFDFRQAGFHEIEVWAVPDHIELTARPSFPGLVEALSERFGRQPPFLNGSMAAPSSASRTARDPSSGSNDDCRRRQGLRASGAKIGSACAIHRSARGCSGTGRRTRIDILVCLSASQSWQTGASGSSAM